MLSLDGLDDYASGPDGAAYDLGTGATDDFTLETHFYVAGVSSFQTGTLFFKTSSYNVYILFNVSGDQDRIVYRLYTSGTSYVYTYYNVTLADGWHHLAAVFDNENTESSDLFATYLDGSLVASGTAIDWTPGLPNTSGPFYLGGYAGLNSFPGWLEDARISTSVRYSGASYTVPTAPFAADASTAALWHFDETPGTTTFLDSANDNTLTGANGAATYNDDVTAPDAPTLDQPTTPTNQSTVSLTGTAEALSTVPLYDGGNLLGTTSADSGGSFTYQATLSEGEHALSAKARDAAGNTSDASATRNVTVDLTTPTTTATRSPAPNADGWNKVPVTVTLTPVDTGGSGIASTEYSSDGGATWTTGTSVLVSANGTTTLRYRSIDLAGNLETAKSLTVRIDKTRPVPKARYNATVRRYRTATLRYRVNDAYSPKAKTVTIKIFKNGRRVRTTTLRNKAMNTNLTYKFRCTLRRGTYTWKVYATDLAGNTQAVPSAKKLYVK